MTMSGGKMVYNDGNMEYRYIASDLPPINRRIFRESPLGHNGPGKDLEHEEVSTGADC